MAGFLRSALLLVVFLLSMAAAAKPIFVVGVENMNYLPAYAYEEGHYKGYAREVLDAFAQDQGYVFQYRALPVPRLYAEFFDGQVDFKFPDNANWKKEARDGKHIVYSDPVAAFIDGVCVLPEKKTATRDDIHVLGTMAGFTPWAWLDRVKAGKVSISENPSFDALVKQTLVGRVDGVYVNVAVINYQLDQVLKKPGALLFHPALPYSKDNYHLASIKQPQVIREFNAWLKLNRARVDAMKKRHGVEKGVIPD